jgi:hypothetical protein
MSPAGAARAAWERVGRALRYGPALKAHGVPRYVTHDLGDGKDERTDDGERVGRVSSGAHRRRSRARHASATKGR